jgi:hypothetical protein
MAFIRTRHVNGVAYYALVESYRKDGKTCQLVLCSMGQISNIDHAIEDTRFWARQYRENANRTQAAVICFGRKKQV